MIKNERQYRLTKSQLSEFEESLQKLKFVKLPAGVDPTLADFYRQALESEFHKLTAEVEEYQTLRSGEVVSFIADNLAELPSVIIKARIARNLTQRELADRLNLKEQQVQRWEATDYRGATLETLKSVVDALGIEVREELFLPVSGMTMNNLLQKVTAAGFTRELLLQRLIPRDIAALLQSGATVGFKELVHCASIFARILDAPLRTLLSPEELTIPFGAVASARFKLPARRNAIKVNAYTAYAHYLALLLESCALPLQSTSLISDAHEFHRTLTSTNQPMTLPKLLTFLWNSGIIVLPLRDAGMFHGAIWRIRDRFVIVTKQTTSLESRWLYDLLHETAHAAKGHVTEDEAIVEGEPISPDIKGEEEVEANEWAEDVLFDGKSEEIEEACVRACGKRLQKLKAVLPNVAKQFNVHVGALANHMAYRMASEGETWWGAANNLQTSGADPFAITRDILLSRINLYKLNSLDRDLVMQALMEE